MAFREFQTAAARVLYADHATDAIVGELTSRFRLHPLDAEGFFAAPVESTFSTYGSYACLTLLWPAANRSDISVVRFVVDGKMLVVIGDTKNHQVANWFDRLEASPQQPPWQASPYELCHELFALLRSDWTAVMVQAPAGLTERFASAALVIRQLGRWIVAQPRPAAVPALILDAHHLDVLGDRFRNSATVSIKPSAQLFGMPRLLGTYAVVAAVMVVMVIVTISIR